MEKIGIELTVNSEKMFCFIQKEACLLSYPHLTVLTLSEQGTSVIVATRGMCQLLAFIDKNGNGIQDWCTKWQ